MSKGGIDSAAARKVADACSDFKLPKASEVRLQCVQEGPLSHLGSVACHLAACRCRCLPPSLPPSLARTLTLRRLLLLHAPRPCRMSCVR